MRVALALALGNRQSLITFSVTLEALGWEESSQVVL